ncbi:MAG: hypothetical protein WC683_00080 [bacterium]
MATGSNIRQRMFAALAVRGVGDEAAVLLEYLGSGEAQSAKSVVDLYVSDPSGDVAMDSLIAQMAASEHFSSLAEVHPAWILEHLKGETPRVVGLILRALPSGHVRYLLKNLPPMLRECVPNIMESFAVKPEVLELIRRRFEAGFLPMRVTRSVTHPGFEHLYYLKSEELSELIRELGLYEMSIALAGMENRALHMVFNRLDLKDAKRLQKRMKHLEGVSSELHRQARYNLLEIEGRHEGSEKMLSSVGLAALASCFGAEHDNSAKLLRQKLAPLEAYLLKRFIDERRKNQNPAVAAQRRGIVEGLVAQLAEDGRINPEWRKFHPDYRPDEEGRLSEKWDEETISMKI